MSTLFIGLAIPFSALHAQAPQNRYGRSPNTGVLYLLPNRDLTEGSSRRPVASGLSVSCSPGSINAAILQTVTWSSSITGGSGGYSYMWGGTEGLSGNASAVSKAYLTGGEKFATLTVTSGTRQITVSCGSTFIGSAAAPGPYVQFGGTGVSCYAVPERVAPGESVTWLSIVSGPITASTTYAWDGTDNLTGDRPVASKSYTALGSKHAVLTLTTGNSRKVAVCTNIVTVGPKIVSSPKPPAPPTPPTPKPVVLEIQGLCAPSSAKATPDDTVTWHGVAIGGDGTYKFTWKGDGGLAGEGATTSLRYEIAGVKKVAAKIDSGDKTLTIACSPIEITGTKATKIKDRFSATALFSWLGGPVGFVLAAILAIIIGILIALKKRSKEEKAEEDEGDHVR